MKPDVHDVAVVGAGPAGIAASIYLKRAGFDLTFFERDEVGGLLLNANQVENYPGFPEGISGGDLANIFKRQLANRRVNVTRTDVIRVLAEKGIFRVQTKTGDFLCYAVIVATGTAPRNIEIESMNKLIGERIFYEIKDVPSLRNGKRVLVIGGGDAAFDYALNLARDSCHVKIVMRGQEPKCLSLLEERVRKMSKIKVIPLTNPMSVREEKGSIVLVCESKGKKIGIPCDYMLIACGRSPNLDILLPEVSERIESGGAEIIPGLFLAGDVKRGDFRQVGIAVGDGLLAAMSAAEYLKKRDVRGLKKEGVHEDTG